MSVVFDALKKGQAATVSPALSAPPAPFPVAATLLDAPTAMPLKGLALAALSGVLLAGGGAWLYWAGRAAVVSVPVQLAISPPPAPVAAPAPIPVPVLASVATPAPVTALVRPEAVRVMAPTPAPVRVVVPPVSVVVSAAPVPTPATPAASAAALVAPSKQAVIRPPINTLVQVNIEANPLDVREAFQTFLRQVKLAQFPDAQRTADQISAAMGATHVMSLRAQGYLALQQNDLVQAKLHYLQLKQALPEDREAGLNLALVDWRQGDIESAARRAERLVDRFPNDPEIRALYLNIPKP